MIRNPLVKGGDAADGSLTPGSGRSLAGGNGNPLQYSCLENSTDREARWPTVHEVTKDLETAEHARVSGVEPHPVCLFCPQEASYSVQFTLRGDYEVQTREVAPCCWDPHA